MTDIIKESKRRKFLNTVVITPLALCLGAAQIVIDINDQMDDRKTGGNYSGPALDVVIGGRKLQSLADFAQVN